MFQGTARYDDVSWRASCRLLLVSVILVRIFRFLRLQNITYDLVLIVVHLFWNIFVQFMSYSTLRVSYDMN